MKAGLHPLGFVKRDLLRLFGYRVRLHVWTHPDPQRHSHRWPFIGLPLRGRFADRRWIEVAGCSHVRLDCPEPGLYGVRPPLTNPQPCALNLHRLRIHRPLVPYLCRYGEIHSVAPYGPSPHVSLVFIGRKRTSISHVYREAADA